jgi:hypothetical protein
MPTFAVTNNSAIASSCLELIPSVLISEGMRSTFYPVVRSLLILLKQQALYLTKPTKCRTALRDMIGSNFEVARSKRH